ncbi:MAG: carB [Dehalococcoidia bacterium]|nr:carB [Dehalococcoidia bacterium]
MPDKPKKVLVIGSGPIVIGQAAEFDYAGTQACRALREEGVTSVLVNSNPATIMTDEGVADIVYIEPLTVESVERIIRRERPDGLLPTLGGQTGLNLAVELAEAGVLERYGVRLLGTPLESIRKAEDRELFKNLLLQIGEPVPESATVRNLEQAKETAEHIGLPLVIRPAFTLGGTGGGIANTWDEFLEIAANGLAVSPIHQVLVERSLAGWKEIEYEVMRDASDNCVTICNMENFDPMGVHTGDSIVVAPSQTLSDHEYQMLRTASLKIIRALGIEGGCNVQLALAPYPGTAANPAANGREYYVIEVNPRVSRSSALASKATGYPIARVAAKIAIGKRLDEIPNAVTGKTLAAFEPALDYCVVKIPRWPFDKFADGDRKIGTQMKATGEVMAIDRTFEAALQKAVRSLESGGKSILWEDAKWFPDDTLSLEDLPLYPNDLRLWVLLGALRRGATPEDLSLKTGIDPWFTRALQDIVSMERRLLEEPLNPPLLLEAKRMGFSDDVIGTLADRLPEQIRETRKGWNIRPAYKMVDTCAAEFAADTPYFYSTYGEENEAESAPGPKALVIGSGPIRIGQGIEFDYASVHASEALKAAGVKSVMVNSNPETVSTDFDSSYRLYFEPLDSEALRDILENEGVLDPISGAIQFPPTCVQFGGQTAVNLAEPLARAGMPFLGAGAQALDLAEDRGRFENFLSGLGVPQPPGAGVFTLSEAIKVADAIGYPVLVRPSYVLGGRAMEIVHGPSELAGYVRAAMDVAGGKRILVDKYMQGKEVEVDAVCDGTDVLIPGVMEHIERAGVHSGDAMCVYPGRTLSPSVIDTMVEYTHRIAVEMGFVGLMNVQFIIMPPDDPAKDGVYILEVNPRSSRTVPFISKVTGIPMVKVAAQVMLGKSLKELGYEPGLAKKKPLFAIKAPVFSMSKLAGVDTYLGPEMKSTGEVMGVDATFEAALAKALIAAGLMLPREGGILLSIADRDKPEAAPLIRRLAEHGYDLYATEGTAAMIESLGLVARMITKKLSEGHPNVVDVIKSNTVQAVINTISGGGRTSTPTTTGQNGAGSGQALRDGFYIRRAAVERRIPCFTSLDTATVAVQASISENREYSIRPLREYLSGDR